MELIRQKISCRLRRSDGRYLATWVNQKTIPKMAPSPPTTDAAISNPSRTMLMPTIVRYILVYETPQPSDARRCRFGRPCMVRWVLRRAF